MSDVNLRPELTELPPRMRNLPVDKRGYPVPWFVQWINGEPEFRLMDQRKWIEAVNHDRCWVCGGKLGANLAFVIGPMCGINRTTSEPACHLSCAEWSCKNCPFLVRPHMVRREDEFTERLAKNPAGVMLKRNPGVMLIWVTRGFRVFTHDGKPLISVGDPEHVAWYSEGRPATIAEIEASIAGGLPSILELCKDERDRKEVYRRYEELKKLYPVEAPCQP